MSAEPTTIHVEYGGKTTVALGVAFGICAGFILGIVLAVVGQSGIDRAAVETGIMQVNGKVYRVTEVHP